MRSSGNSLWMRAVSFVGLRDLLGFVVECPEGLQTRDIERLMRQDQVFRTQRGRPPSRTTVYHYRNTLLRLGVLVRQGRRYAADFWNPLLRDLIRVLHPGAQRLSPEERRLFSELVLANEDCRRWFFDFFVPEPRPYDFEEFLSLGQRVAWKAYPGTEGRRVLLYSLDDERRRCWLRTEAEFQAVLYGVRYWARNQLSFLDELFLEDLGGVMFPVQAEGPVPDPQIARSLLNLVKEEVEWTVLSVRDLAFRWGPQFSVPLRRIFATLSAVHRAYPEYVVVIPTARAFATITAETPSAEAYQLRSYLEEEGCYASHLRIHRKLKEVFRWKTLSGASN